MNPAFDAPFLPNPLMDVQKEPDQPEQPGWIKNARPPAPFPQVWEATEALVQLDQRTRGTLIRELNEANAELTETYRLVEDRSAIIKKMRRMIEDRNLKLASMEREVMHLRGQITKDSWTPGLLGGPVSSSQLLGKSYLDLINEANIAASSVTAEKTNNVQIMPVPPAAPVQYTKSIEGCQVAPRRPMTATQKKMVDSWVDYLKKASNHDCP